MRGWLLCGMLLLAAPGALAEVLRVDALRLSPEAPWRRGDPVQEQEDGVYLLEWSPAPEGSQGVALQVALPREATRLKTGVEAFQANLRKKWGGLYGRAAEIRELEIGSLRWLACRRPTGDGSAIVFQLATVHEGRAYSLLAFASQQATGLPKPVHDLLAGVNFGPEARGWIASRVVAVQPGREALEALVQIDAERLGENGMLTGYGVEYAPLQNAAHSGQSLAWFMEGFKWRNVAGRDERQPVSQSGHIEAKAPAREPGVLTVSLHLAKESPSDVAAEVSLIDLCGPASELDAALAQLERGAHVPLQRLLRDRPAACPTLPGHSLPRVLLAQPGHAVTETLAFPLSPAPPLAAGLSSVRVIAVKPRLVGDDDALGQGLLRQLGLYFIYAAE